MGSSHSTQHQNVALAIQKQPIAGINSFFCHPDRIVTLCEKAHTFSSRHTFEDVCSGATLFEMTSATFTSRQTLVDANGEPVANYKKKSLSTKPVGYVRAGSIEDGAELFQVHLEYRSDGSSVLKVEFTDASSGTKCELGFVGDWYHRDGYFWLDRGCKGNHEPVAKVYCPDSAARSKYQVDIAHNMDTALIALLCGILRAKEASVEQTTASVGLVAAGI